MTTEDKALGQTLQRSTVTGKARHIHLIQVVRTQFLPEKWAKHAFEILSYGCSTGEEILTLNDVFSDAKYDVVHITGVDIDTTALEKACILLSNLPSHPGRQHQLISAQQFAAQPQKIQYQFITCFNVLCNHFSGQSRQNAPIKFELFQKSIVELIGFLAPGGVLCTYGTNYCVLDVVLPTDISVHALNIDSGPVPMYAPDGTTLRPRGIKNVYVLCKKPTPEDSTTTTTTIEHKAVELSQNMFHITERGKLCELGYIPHVRPKVVFGLLRPGSQSTNLGDYMQTLAQVHVLSTFYNAATWRCSPAIRHIIEHFAKSKPSGNFVRQQQHPSDVKIIWIDRDDSSEATAYTDDVIHVIANGWYMHRDRETQTFKFPFASCIRPIFVSVHIAHPSMLDQENICDYFKQYAPIGCRDRATLSLMQSKQIPSYFSSCLTTTLECYIEGTATTTSGVMLDVDTLDNNASHILVGRAYNADEMLDMAFEKLLSYGSATRIRSTRIHCLLPVRACSEIPELIFCNKTGGQENAWMERSRFSGLTDIMQDDNQREILATALFGQMVDRVHDILFGLPTRQCDDKEAMDFSHQDFLGCYPRDIRMLHPSIISCKTTTPLYSSMAVLLETKVYKVKHEFNHRTSFILRKSPLAPFKACIDILLTFDSGYTDIFATFLRHLTASNSSSLLRLWCVTRRVTTWPPIAKCPSNVILFHVPVDDCVDFADYASPLKHVSEVCLDRLLVEKIDFGHYKVERIIYLDLDIAVVSSLAPLLDLDSGPMGIIAKSSIVQNVMNSWVAKYKTSLPLQYTYSKSCNAGVLVMDISKLKRNGMYAFCKTMYERHGFNDQILLNFYAQAQYRELPGQYNIFVGQDETKFTSFPDLPNSAVAFHFVGSHKPWISQSAESYSIPALYQLWHRYTEKAAKKKAHKHIPG